MRKLRKKFSRPRMLWDTQLIQEDKAILNEFGLRRKGEIWKAKELVRDFRRRARELNAIKDKQKEKILLDKINKLGFVKANSLDDILSINLKNILERRLQTLVFKKGLAKTMKQARQLITHGHISVSGKRATFPSFIVSVAEENQISFYGDFSLKEPEKVEVKNEDKPVTEGQQPEEVKEEGVAS